MLAESSPSIPIRDCRKTLARMLFAPRDGRTQCSYENCLRTRTPGTTFCDEHSALVSLSLGAYHKAYRPCNEVSTKHIHYRCSLEAMMNGKCLIHKGVNTCALGCKKEVTCSNFCGNHKTEEIVEATKLLEASLQEAEKGKTFTRLVTVPVKEIKTEQKVPTQNFKRIACEHSQCQFSNDIPSGTGIVTWYCSEHEVHSMCHECSQRCDEIFRNSRGEGFCSVKCSRVNAVVVDRIHLSVHVDKRSPIGTEGDYSITCRDCHRRITLSKYREIAMYYCNFCVGDLKGAVVECGECKLACGQRLYTKLGKVYCSSQCLPSS